MGLLLCIYVSVVLDEFTPEEGIDLQHKQNHTFIGLFCRTTTLLSVMALVQEF